MKVGKILSLFAIATLCASVACATSVELGLNDDTVQAQVFVPLSQDAYGTAQFGVRGFYDDDYDTRLGSAELSFLGRPGNAPGLTAGVGAAFWAGRVGHEPFEFDILSLGIGARVGYAPPQLMGVGFDAKLFYAPQILTGGDSERLIEGAVRASYAFIPKARVFVEYQQIHVDAEGGGDGNLDSDMRVGFEARF